MADRGPSEIEKAGAAGLALFASEVQLQLDTAGAEAYKTEIEAKIEALKQEAAALTGKENKKARTEKEKEASGLKSEKKYIDALRVLKGSDPPNGNFILAKTGGEMPTQAAVEEAPKEEPKKEEKEKKEKPKKEKAGLTSEEEKELSKLKDDLIARKAELKAQGMSGGQQNKDEQVVAWVTRMNELKEKQEPGSTQKKEEPGKKKKGALSEADKQEFDALKQKIEDYKAKLVAEFGYGKKDMKGDPDLCDMEAELAAFEKRAK